MAVTSPSTRHLPATTRSRWLEEAGLRLGLAHAWIVLAALVSAAVALPGPVSLPLVALAGLLVVRRLGVGWRLAVGLSAWAVWTGFLHHDLGTLTLSGPDVVRLDAVLLLAALVRPWARLAR